MQGTQNNNVQGELMRGGNSTNRWPHFYGMIDHVLVI